MALFWFAFCLLLIFVEITTVNLVSIWFAIGAFFAMIMALFSDVFLLQVIIFIIISIITLLITKPLVKKSKIVIDAFASRKTGIEATNYDRVIGKHAEVIKKITPDDYGQVKVLGSTWTAVCDKVCDVSEKVIVKRVDGVKLVVEKEEK